MKRYTPLFVLISIFISFSAFAQLRPGSLRGIISDAADGEAIAFATVVVKQDSTTIIAGAYSDFDGIYGINPIDPGTYTVEIKYIGYATTTIKEVNISPNTPTLLNVKMQAESETLQEVVIIRKSPLIEKSRSSKITTAEDIQNMAVRDISSIASPAAGVTQDANGNTSIRGSRSEGTVYFIDGVKVRGRVNIPQAAIAEKQVITGGTPAQYESKSDVPKQESKAEEPMQIFYESAPAQQFSGEYYKSIPENEFLGVYSSPLSTFGADVDVASYANVRRMLKSGALPHPDAVRLEEFINYFTYDYPEPDGASPFSVTVDQRTCDWNKAHRLLRVGLKTESIKTEDLPASNLVFLIDVSGSMSYENKLPLLQSAMRIMVKNLKPEDRVAIVVYASSTGLVLESTPASNSNEILNAINNLNAGGSTAGGAGIKLAYKVARQNFNPDHNNRVILATDGDFNVGVSSDEGLIKLIEEERESGVFLSVLGFGTGNYQDSKMEQLADHGNGNYAYIDGLMEARKVLAEEMGANLHVVAKDTKFQVEFNPRKVAAYRLLGYENRLLEAEDFDDDLKDAGDIGAGHTVTAVYELIMRNPEEADSAWSKEQKLRYQEDALKDQAFGDELALLKLRYKEPQAKKSKLMLLPITESESVNPDFAFLSAVLQYGLLLRQSEYAANSSLESAIDLAERHLGKDPHGYRREFVKLCKLAQDLN